MEAISTPFKLPFKVMNFYGFYLPEGSKFRSKFCGFCAFSFINVQFMLASVYRLCLLKNFDDFLLEVLYAIFSFNLTFKVISFKWNENEILEVARDFQDLERKMNSNDVVKLHAEIKKSVKNLFMTDFAVGFVLCLAVLVLSNGRTFVIAVLYQTDNSSLYYVLFALHYVQILGIGTSSIAVESILTISLMLMQAQIEEMKKMIQDLTAIKGEALRNLVDFHAQLLR